MRPADLPDFGKPPLNEVVLGVQFAPPSGYSQIRAGQVWDLFKSKYPHTEEYMPLPPVFETFGPRVVAQANQLEFLDGPLHDRYWFLNEARDELIQFQQDRLLHNWRKVGDKSNDYPRFEPMIAEFEDQLGRLEQYFATLSPQSLQITQCEVSYINHIVPREPDMLRVSDWLNFVQFDGPDPQGLSLSFRETISSQDGPKARLICEVGESIAATGQRLFGLTLTVRGAPQSPSISSTLEFLKEGRKIIVRRFAGLTTALAHKEWERSK